MGEIQEIYDKYYIDIEEDIVNKYNLLLDIMNEREIYALTHSDTIGYSRDIIDSKYQIEIAALEYQKSKELSNLVKLKEDNTPKIKIIESFYDGYLRVTCVADLLDSKPVWASIEDKTNDSLGSRNNFNKLPSVPLNINRDKSNFSIEADRLQDTILFSHHIIRVFLSFIPVGMLRICVFDPEEKAVSIKPFFDFKKKTKNVFDEKIYTKNDELITLLEELDAQMESCIQNKLGAKYEDIYEYNKASNGINEKITLLVLYDFPSHVDKRCLDALGDIMKNGNKCGIYTVICNNASSYDSKEYGTPSKEDIVKLEEYCNIIKYVEDTPVLLPEESKLFIPKIEDDTLIDTFTEAYIAEQAKIQESVLGFDKLCISDKKMDTNNGISIPIGFGSANSIVNLSMGDNAPHGLIIGGTGSGKSTLLHTIILSGMLNYSPDELRLYLMDFKSGTEFQVYEANNGKSMPHIGLLALDAVQEFGESILEELEKEMKERAKRFKQERVANLMEYRLRCNNPMPRIIVIIDEYQVLFDRRQNSKVADNCAKILSGIIKQGRSYGVHLLMSTQSMSFSDLSISGDELGQMRLRVGLNWSDSDTTRLFGIDDENIRHLKEGPKGTAVMTENPGNKMVTGFRVAYCDSVDREKYLHQITETYSEYKNECRIFDGSKEYPLLETLQKSDITKNDIYIGETVKIGPPLVHELSYSRNSNLLVCGTDDIIERRIFKDYIVSLMNNSDVTIYCIDGDMIRGFSDRDMNDFYGVISSLNSKFKMARNQGDCITFIKELFNHYINCKKGEDKNDLCVVLIRNLQLCEVIRSILSGENIDESDYIDNILDDYIDSNTVDLVASMMLGENVETNITETRPEDTTSLTDKIYRLMNFGYGCGIHFLVTSKDYGAIKDASASFNASILKYFHHRIIFSLSDDNASTLIEGVKVSSLLDDTVYYSDGIMSNFQVKPYKEPEIEEIKSYFQLIK